jgi:hypothetical protein
MRLLLLTDSDIQTFVGGVRIGPLTPDATRGETIIKPRQINLMIAPNIGIDRYFSSHAAEATIPVVIAFYDHFTAESSNASASPNVTAYDYFEHIQKILANGTEGAGDGRIVNPDDPTNPAATLKYLNITSPTFRTLLMGASVGSGENQNIARCYAAIAAYETRETSGREGRA